MIQKLIVPVAVVCLLASCGNGKKLESANAQITQLQANNRQLMKDGDALKKQVSDLSDGNNSLTQQLNNCKSNAEATAQKLRSTEATMREEEEKMKAVQRKIDAAMADFESKGVSIFLRNGLVHVNMEDKLLYKTGSSALSDDGKDALTHLADVLNGYPRLGIIVLGNTDTIMFKRGSDNWALSTERSNAVVRVLQAANISPDRLTSAGKSKFNPIADNSTAEGRARNRRTDIILNPDMDRIWQSVENDHQ